MPPTSAPGFRMEKAIVGVAHRVLFGALSFAAQEEQAFNGEITDRMCSGLARPHDASPFEITFMNVVGQRTIESLWGDSRVGSWFVVNVTKDLIVEFREQLEAGDGQAERLLFLMDRGRDGEVSSGSPVSTGPRNIAC